jgi:hypothetical protein
MLIRWTTVLGDVRFRVSQRLREEGELVAAAAAVTSSWRARARRGRNGRRRRYDAGARQKTRYAARVPRGSGGGGGSSGSPLSR